MKRGTLILGATFLAAAAAGCAKSQPEAEYSEVCVEQVTELRVDDDECPGGKRHRSGTAWYYVPIHSAVGPVGSKVTGGSYAKPSAPVPRVARGGFGGRVSSGGGS